MASNCTHNCSTCNSECSHENKSQLLSPSAGTKIKHIVGVVSGKGGVGKSMVTSMIAVALSKKGFKVGILDSDITGPSIPKAFGIGEGVSGTKTLMYPPKSKGGIEVMSINLLVSDPSEPVLWRGPLFGGAIKNFYSDTKWGELDYLLIDMPPGTSDVALTVFNQIPIDGVILVSTPQDLVKMIVGKAVNMCKKMNINVLGLVENMAYYKCPCCGNPLFPFGPSKLNDVCETFDITPIASLPIDTNLASLIDKGSVEDADTSSFENVLAILNTLD